MTTLNETLTPQVQNTGLVSKLKTYAPHAIAGIASLVFLDSLRFKFTNAPETQVIFGKLNDWAASFGADGLFAQTGLFSQYVIGTAELVAVNDWKDINTAAHLIKYDSAHGRMSGPVEIKEDGIDFDVLPEDRQDL